MQLLDIQYNLAQKMPNCIGGSTTLDYLQAYKIVEPTILNEKTTSEAMLRGTLIHEILLEGKNILNFDVSTKKTITEGDISKKLLPPKELMSLQMLQKAFCKKGSILFKIIFDAKEIEKGYVWQYYNDLLVRCKPDFVTEESGEIWINDLKTTSVRSGGFVTNFQDKYDHQMRFYGYLMSFIYPNVKINSRIITLKITDYFSFDLEVREEKNSGYSETEFDNIINEFQKKIDLISNDQIVIDDSSLFFSFM